MTARSTAHARWEGTLQEGSGTATTASPALASAAITWRARIGEGGDQQVGTTPEELLAAAHASCFAMALSGALAKAGITPERLNVTATCGFGPADGGFAVTGVRLQLEAAVPGVDEATLVEHASGAKEGCPISKAIAGNVPIELETTLLS